MRQIALVTGAAGFIGSHLGERLVRDGWEVRGVDCFTDYYDVGLKRRNISALWDQPRFRLIEADLRTVDPGPLLDGVDVVFHLAAQAGVRASWGRAFEEYTGHNIMGTQRLLEAAVGRPIRRIVNASSSSVYGEAPAFPVPEDGPLRPISPYGVTKLAAEHLCRLYARAQALPVTSLRFFTVYGPRQRPDMAFHRFFRAIHEGKPLGVFGDGNQTRDFTYVEDVVTASLLAAEKGEAGEAYNISGGSRVRLLDAIRLMEKAAGREAHIEHRPRQKGDPPDTGGDASRARKQLGFAPAVPLEEGLVRMGAWMSRYLEGKPE